ncbi:hypothetical protein NLG97_g3537 [Lecanicillium saksenae]|uniref:Uncharacterized protein n=1 Tax=Lecanicillium saksenae TaxID=468837 RepID=A0ACC1R0H9_9HYPO|nr:hypothetical protein NLG97_g3537 [Lecanicillium saksenae]
MVNILHLPNELLGSVIEQLVTLARRDKESLVPYALVCRRFQYIVECSSFEVIRLRASNTEGDLRRFRRLFKPMRRRRVLCTIELDFALRTTAYDLPDFLYGSEEQRALFAMLRVDARVRPLLSHTQFEAQLAQDNIRMTRFLVQTFTALNSYFKDRINRSRITVRLIAETPTY